MRWSKHIDLKYHFVKVTTETGITLRLDTNLDGDYAHEFTEPLVKVKLKLIRKMIGVKLWENQKIIVKLAPKSGVKTHDN